MASLTPIMDAFYQGREQPQREMLGQLQQAQGLIGILSAVQQQQQRQQALQEQTQIKGILSRAAQETGGDPAKMAPLLMQTGHPELVKLGQSMIPKGNQIGSGGFLKPDGTIVPPAARPDAKKPERWSEPYNMNGVVVQRNLDTGQIKTAVTREPQVRVTNEAPVTPVTLQDPDDPRGTIIVDGRTGKRIGKGPKMTQAGAIDAKADIAMGGLGADLQSAEDLLTGVVRTSDGQVVRGNLPTASGAGALANKALAFVGVTGSGAPEAAELKTVAARLVGRVPRFEGPQSDKDVQLYKEAAGQVGNDDLPRPTRLAALRRMRAIYAGYESGQRGRITGGRRSADGGTQPVVVDW